MSVPTVIEKEAGEVVENARASLEACPCGCNREATANLFAAMATATCRTAPGHPTAAATSA